MQVSLDNNIYRTQRQYSFANSTLPNKNSNYNTGNYNPSFCAATATKPVISNKISNEKSRILKKLNEILKTNIPILDKDQLWEVIERRAIAIIRMKNRKKFMHENELEAIYNSPYMTNQQKINRVCEIDKEKKRNRKN